MSKQIYKAISDTMAFSTTEQYCFVLENIGNIVVAAYLCPTKELFVEELAKTLKKIDNRRN